ncbi:MAG: hypothetical protein ABEJ65_02440 [bacterium]
MNVSRYNVVGLFLIVFLLVTGCGGGEPPTKREIWQKYVNLYKGYQKDLYEFSVKKWPRFKPVFELQKRYQMKRTKLRTMKFVYILEHDPNRIITNRGIHEFVNFPWTSGDTKKFVESVKGAESLVNKVNRLEKKNNNHPMWPKVREKFRALPPDSKYKELNRSFQSRLRGLSSWLERYNQARDRANRSSAPAPTRSTETSG